MTKHTTKYRRPKGESRALVEKIKKLATVKGLGPDRIAKNCRCSRRYVYMAMNKWRLPRNPTVAPESRREQQIVAAYVRLRRNEKAVAKVFSMSVGNVRKVIKAVKARA